MTGITQEQVNEAVFISPENGFYTPKDIRDGRTYSRDMANELGITDGEAFELVADELSAMICRAFELIK